MIKQLKHKKTKLVHTAEALRTSFVYIINIRFQSNSNIPLDLPIWYDTLHRHINASVIVHFQNIHTILVELLTVKNPVNNLFHNLFTFLYF